MPWRSRRVAGPVNQTLVIYIGPTRFTFSQHGTQRVSHWIIGVIPHLQGLCCCLSCRLMSDLLMLAAFGDAKERNKQQFEALFGATGWKLTKITPSNGIFLILEAVPV
eukprot:GHUV01030125.1.p2 GENE.GHUV01030125.1~~GHUV01030125.1.p2  ORF type:complete len:108 (+),score=13.91 GHUV01030125.1:214-537(+)